MILITYLVRLALGAIVERVQLGHGRVEEVAAMVAGRSQEDTFQQTSRIHHLRADHEIVLVVVVTQKLQLFVAGLNFRVDQQWLLVSCGRERGCCGRRDKLVIFGRLRAMCVLASEQYG